MLVKALLPDTNETGILLLLTSDMNYYELPSDKAFLISVKAIILNADGQALLLKVGNDNPTAHDRGKWDLPGGLIEWGENPEHALGREVKEECGLEIENIKLVAVDAFHHGLFYFQNAAAKDIHVIVIGYTCHYRGGTVQLDEEHIGFEWMNLKTITEEHCTPNSKGLIKQFLL